MTGSLFLRRLQLPRSIVGALWLGPMPGLRRSFSDDLRDLETHNISRIVVLAPLTEIQEKAPAYASALAGGACMPVVHFPIVDFGVPKDEAGLVALVKDTALALSAGERVFVHCAAGIGRTGTFAICILRAFGFHPEEAAAVVADAGSGPETETQKELVSRFAVAPEINA